MSQWPFIVSIFTFTVSIFTCSALSTAWHRKAIFPPHPLNQSFWLQNVLSFYIFGMAVMPFLYRDLSFLTKFSYHRNLSLAVYLPILFFSFCQKTNTFLNLYSAISCNVIIACWFFCYWCLLYSNHWVLDSFKLWLSDS